MTYTIEKSKILYNCPGCNNPLESRLEEAGAQDTCPICGRTFVVPAREEVQRLQAEKARLAEERRKVEEATRARKAELARERQAEQAAMEEQRRAARVEYARQELVAEEIQEKTTIPPYKRVRTYISNLASMGWLCYIAAALAAGAGIVIAIKAPEFDVFALLIGLSVAALLAALGFWFLLMSELLGAFRDIAVNSWRTAIAAEKSAQS